jgi:hypothetical protein
MAISKSDPRPVRALRRKAQLVVRCGNIEDMFNAEAIIDSFSTAVFQ